MAINNLRFYILFYIRFTVKTLRKNVLHFYRKISNPDHGFTTEKERPEKLVERRVGEYSTSVCGIVMDHR